MRGLSGPAGEDVWTGLAISHCRNAISDSVNDPAGCDLVKTENKE
jgi:hypothetical protein